MLIFNKPEESTSKCPTEIYSRRVDQVKKKYFNFSLCII